MTRAEIEAELHEAVQSYRDCSASAENARQILALGMGSISDVTTKTYLEESAHARWLKAAERFAAIAADASANAEVSPSLGASKPAGADAAANAILGAHKLVAGDLN